MSKVILSCLKLSKVIQSCLKGGQERHQGREWHWVQEWHRGQEWHWGWERHRGQGREWGSQLNKKKELTQSDTVQSDPGADSCYNMNVIYIIF